MRKTAMLFALITSVSLVGITALGQKAATAPTVSLRVAFQISDSTGTPCQIRGDNGGDYIDGVEDVQAVISKYGGVLMNFAKGPNAVGRLVYFDYSRPYSPPPPGAHVPPAPGLQQGSWFQTAPLDNAPYPLIQLLPIGETQCVKVKFTFDRNDGVQTQWRNNFHLGQYSPDSAFTSYAVVSRIDANTWEIEPKAHPCNAANFPTVTELLDTPTGPSTTIKFTRDGLYYMPFKLTLVRK